jgi:hypothetical protein
LKLPGNDIGKLSFALLNVTIDILSTEHHSSAKLVMHNAALRDQVADEAGRHPEITRCSVHIQHFGILGFGWHDRSWIRCFGQSLSKQAKFIDHEEHGVD